MPEKILFSVVRITKKQKKIPKHKKLKLCNNYMRKSLIPQKTHNRFKQKHILFLDMKIQHHENAMSS